MLPRRGLGDPVKHLRFVKDFDAFVGKSTSKDCDQYQAFPAIEDWRGTLWKETNPKKSIIFKLPVASSRWFLGMIFRHSTALRYLKLLVGRSPACMQPMAKIRWAGGEKPKVLEAALLLKMFLGYQTKRLESRSFYFATKSRQQNFGFWIFFWTGMHHGIVVFFCFSRVTGYGNIWPSNKNRWFLEVWTLHPCTTHLLAVGQWPACSTTNWWNGASKMEGVWRFSKPTFSLFAGYMDIQIV